MIIAIILWFASGALGSELMRRRVDRDFPMLPPTQWSMQPYLWHCALLGPVNLLPELWARLP